MANRIDTEGNRLLAVCTAALTAAGADIPGRAFFSPCPPIAECDQLVVSLSRIFFGAPGQEQSAPRGLQGPHSCEYGIALFHCLPVGTNQGKPASASTWSAFGEKVTDQAVAVYLALLADALAQQCREAVGPLTTLADEGAIGGFTTTYQAAL